MKKITLWVFMLISFVFADGFKAYREITPSMPISEVVFLIQNVPDGQVLVFKEGTYDFHNSTIELKNKNYIAIVSENRSKLILIKNLFLKCIECDNIYLSGLSFVTDKEKEYILFLKSSNVHLSRLYFENYLFRFFDSTGRLENIMGETRKNKVLHQENPYYIVDSKIVIDKSIFFNGNKRNMFLLENSFFNMTNSFLSNMNKSSILSKKSFLVLKNNDFGTNKCYFDGKLGGSVIDGSFVSIKKMTKEQWGACKYANYKSDEFKTNVLFLKDRSFLIAQKNRFINQGLDILLSNSKAKIMNNIFDGFSSAIELYEKSEANITENKMINGMSNVKSIGIKLSGDSKSIIHQNKISKVFNGIIVKESSEAEITNNIIIGLRKYRYKNSDGKYKFLKGTGVSIFTEGKANIINTKYNSDKYDCGYAGKDSLVYLQNNDHGFDLPGIGDPQVTKSKIPIKVEEFKDFTSVFKDLDTFRIPSITNLKKYDEISKNTIVPTKVPTNILKGCLKEDIIVENNDGDEEEIEKGTHIIFNKDKKVFIEPKEYAGIELDEIPKVDTSIDKRKIIVNPEIKKKKGKYFVYFTIDSNVNINEIQFKGKTLKIKEKTIKNYKTKGRRVKNLSGIYSLTIIGNGFNETYECKINSGLDMKCHSKESPEF